MTPMKKILHLEDDNDWIEIVRNALDGYEVHGAHNLREAVKLYSDQLFEVVILDISLIPDDSQDIQGEQLLKALEGLQILPGKRIIILSAYLLGLANEDRTRKYFKFYDVMDAIPKQKFDSKEFREIVDEAIRMPNVFNEE
jgi:CheY-like chemotaxis protein